MIKVRICRKCGENVGDETIECPSCGANLTQVGVKIVQTDKCPSCGHKLSGGGTVCRKCGSRNDIKRSAWTMP